MTLIVSAAVAVIFAAGSYLLLQRDLVRVVGGVVLISSAATLFVMAASLTKGAAPILPLPAGQTPSDPLVQAMALTAIVITFGVSALLLALVFRVYVSHLSLDLDDLAAAEAREEAEYERTGQHPDGLPMTLEERDEWAMR
ncbi:MAG TPA: NADH-quinone oxidoreductase subunit K [Thermomicrobiales bacterium]|nr:NADH-quinone oxidoreductase subunit K [Thermomicrobiales bacterium]